MRAGRPAIAGLVRGLCLGTAICALAACSHHTPAGTVTVTVGPTTPAPPTSIAPSGSSSPGPTTSAPAHVTHLPGRCGGLLPRAAVDNAVDRSLKGKTAFVVGIAEKDIKRLSYLNCRYGLASPNATPAVEIGVSLYRTAAAAQARIKPTVDDYVGNHGARDSTTQVAGRTAHVLTGGHGAGYVTDTLVLADGQRTIAVSVADPIPAGARSKALVALAALADKRTG